MGKDMIDLLVVGGGTAGIVGAQTAASLGARTLLVERARTGGDCLWTGCVPSKTLLAAASDAARLRRHTGAPVDFDRVRERVRSAIAAIEPVDSPAALEAAGVGVLLGNLRFTGPGRAEVDGRPVAFRQALIATGAAPADPGIPGLDPGRTVTSETVWDLARLPRRLAVVGGGPVACELGQAFARLGSEVTLIVRSGLLPAEDPDAVDVLREALVADGLRILEHAVVRAAEVEGSGDVEGSASPVDGAVRLRLGDGTAVDADVVLLATGRVPRTAGLGLDALGVGLDEAGRVATDTRLRTSVPTVWAAGDVTSRPRHTHSAGIDASLAASNAVLGLRRRVDDAIPRVTFTSPEIAAVGARTGARRHGSPAGPVSERTVAHTHVDRAITDGDTRGFTRLALGRGGRILGGTIVGARAGESLGELCLAVRHRHTTADVFQAMHPYPTHSDGVWNAAIADVRDRLAKPPLAALTRGLAAVRRARLDRTRRKPVGLDSAPR
ncbi:dihydrolipoyl dehydrogenase family protein [Arthrobacter halodurans]|uniref:NAD(P)/FAD-dependent oxidoreductase n=1 Tax=Arthrobacter halodurans TaxID=516699 RepID=A0ABV4UN09_9MICC